MLDDACDSSLWRRCLLSPAWRGIVEGDTYVLTHLDGCGIVVFEMILVSETVEESEASLNEGREEVFVRLQDGSRTGSRCADEEEKKVRRDFVSGWETRVLYWGQIFERPHARTMSCSGAPLAASFTNSMAVTHVSAAPH